MEDFTELSEPELLVGRGIIERSISAGQLGLDGHLIQALLHDLATDVNAFSIVGRLSRLAPLVEIPFGVADLEFGASNRTLLIHS